MSVATKDAALAPKKILLKDTTPFEKYVLPNGTVVEMCASAKTLETTGRLALRRSPAGNIYAYIIDKKGERRKNSKGEEEYTELRPDLEVEPIPRRGPKRRDDGMWWRGWGRKHNDLMDSLVKTVTDEGFYVKWPESRKNHYANIGFEGNKFCAIFFSGYLGLGEKPEGPLSVFPAVIKTGYKDKNGKFNNAYMPFQIDLSLVLEKGRWADFEATFRRQVKEWKREVLHRSRSQM